MHRIITMHARARETDRQTDGQTDGWTNEHHCNSATIRSTNASSAKNGVIFGLSIINNHSTERM